MYLQNKISKERVYQKAVYAEIVGTHGSCVRRFTIDYQLITNMVSRTHRPCVPTVWYFDIPSVLSTFDFPRLKPGVT